MENKEVQKRILNALKKEAKRGYGLSITDMTNELRIPRSSVRIGIAFLLGAEKIDEQIHGMAKVYYLGDVE